MTDEQKQVPEKQVEQIKKAYALFMGYESPDNALDFLKLAQAHNAKVEMADQLAKEALTYEPMAKAFYEQLNQGAEPGKVIANLVKLFCQAEKMLLKYKYLHDKPTFEPGGIMQRPEGWPDFNPLDGSVAGLRVYLENNKLEAQAVSMYEMYKPEHVFPRPDVCPGKGGQGCNCVEYAEAVNGGQPVKSFECRAKTNDALEREMATPSEALKAYINQPLNVVNRSARDSDAVKDGKAIKGPGYEPGDKGPNAPQIK
jgi:hypothetical protein